MAVEAKIRRTVLDLYVQSSGVISERAPAANPVCGRRALTAASARTRSTSAA